MTQDTEPLTIPEAKEKMVEIQTTINKLTMNRRALTIRIDQLIRLRGIYLNVLETEDT